MASKPHAPPAPPGSETLAAWARQHRYAFEPWPDQGWFRRWEPYETLISAGAYFSAISAPLPPGSVTVAEPWYADPDLEPLDRTLVAWVSHPKLVRHAAARGGDHFNTRVAYLESAPMPRVDVGDADWDRHLATMAASSSEAASAFPRPVREVLRKARFAGHVEVRPGGLVLHAAGVQPDPPGAERLLRLATALIHAY